jgi:hypothetical protein
MIRRAANGGTCTEAGASMVNAYRERKPPEGATSDVFPAAELDLAAYSDEDDGETRMFEVRPPEPRWLVQLTPFDRRAMDTSRLISEVELGLVQRSTLVWRRGMHDWLPIERIGEFLLGPAHRAMARPTWPARGVLVSSALLLLAAVATTLLLAAGGVFG